MMESRLTYGRAMRVTFFLSAGILMFVSVALIVLVRLKLQTISEMWIALPAIAAQLACICGLIALRPLLYEANLISRLGLWCASLAAVIIVSAGLWLGLSGDPQASSGNLIYILAFGYIISICLAFALFSWATFRVKGARSLLAYLLLVPAGLWTTLVVVAVFFGPQIALSLDWITNIAISAALVATARTVRHER